VFWRVIKMKEITIVASVAILAIVFLFTMTATSGEYLGANEISDYIIMVTDGEDGAYLNSETPTAMVINRDIFVDRSGEPKTITVCKDEEQIYVVDGGRKVKKASSYNCYNVQVVEEEETEPATKHDVGYSILEDKNI